MATLETMKGVGLGKSIGNSFGNLKCTCLFVFSRILGRTGTSLIRGGFLEVPTKKIRGVFWPNLVGAFKVLPGNGLGKPDVFNQGGFINHVPPLISVIASSSIIIRWFTGKVGKRNTCWEHTCDNPTRLGSSLKVALIRQQTVCLLV